MKPLKYNNNLAFSSGFIGHCEFLYFVPTTVNFLSWLLFFPFQLQKKKRDGVLFTLLWLLQWHVPVLLWRNLSEESCISFSWHASFWTPGQSSLDCSLILDFYEYGSDFSMIIFVNASTVLHSSLTFFSFHLQSLCLIDFIGKQRSAFIC